MTGHFLTSFKPGHEGDVGQFVPSPNPEPPNRVYTMLAACARR